jgi:hypothetical protein
MARSRKKNREIAVSFPLPAKKHVFHTHGKYYLDF